MRVLALIALFGAGAVLAGCRKQEDAPPSPVAESDLALHVQTAPVAERPMPHYLTLTGTLRSSQESDVAADATGKVIQTFCERGQAVKRGQVLVTLDARSVALAATAAQAQAKVAQSQLDQARRDCERVTHLLQTGAISQAEFDRQTASCTSQQWSAAAAEAQQQSATKMLGDANVRAPFDGVVGERLVNVGQYVQPSTKVVTMYAPDPLRLEITVPEANVASVAPDMPVSFGVVAYGDQTFEGRVKFISPNLRPSTRDLVVEAVVPNPDGRLKPGMFATAKLLLGTQPSPVVPAAAVVRDDTGARVFVVADKQIQERLVQLGESDTAGDAVAIVAGLRPGETVVLKPGSDVHDGARVASVE